MKVCIAGNNTDYTLNQFIEVQIRYIFMNSKCEEIFLYSLISFYLEAVKLRCKKRSTNYIRQNLLQIYYLFIISVFVVLLKRFYFFANLQYKKFEM